MQLTKNKIFKYSLIVFIAGIAAASFSPGFILEKGLIFFSLSGFFLSTAVLFKENKKLFFICLLSFSFFASFFRYSFALPENYADTVQFYNGSRVIFEATVVREPDRRKDSQKLTLGRIIMLERESRELNKEMKGLVLLSAGPFRRFEYGERLRLEGRLLPAEEFNGFRYDRYLARFRIHSLSYYPKIYSLGKDAEFGLKGRIYEYVFCFKDRLRSVISRNMPGDEAGIAKAVVLGDKRGISAENRELFSRAGLSHIVAISGMHIGIISAMLMRFFLGLGFARKGGFFLSVFFLFLYILFIGLPPSAMRAGLMGFLVMWGLYLGRLNKMGHSLILAAALLLTANPRLLRDDIGFQLSFLAVMGIALAYPPISAWLEKKDIRFRALFELLAVTAAAQAFTLPITAINFGIVSLVSPLANLAVLWLLPFLIMAVFLALFLSFFIPACSLLWFLPAVLAIRYIEAAARFCAALPGAYWLADNTPLWLFLLYYFMLFKVFLKLGRN